ncbi:MAG TPA: aldolase/citrate lyase family protein [Candidatus Sulfotelmatobacter sp.]|nr:aldolase/citrate lyase family protein [Candidatus Sulfotelmatobacter sp.]
MTNRMKQKLSAGEPAFGVSVMVPSPQIVEMLGHLGFDWVLLDCEHGTVTLESLELMAMAAQAVGLTPIARPKRNAPEELQAVLDRGVQGVQVPHVNTAEEARQAVAACRYHPEGQRGLAVGTRSARYGIRLSLAEHTAEANAETLVCIQLEEAEALANLEAILAVPGVDVFFLGPSDLSQSLGFPGRPDAPVVKTAMAQAFAAIRAAGRIAGCAGNAAATVERLGRGVRYTYTHLPNLLTAGGDAFLKAVRPAPPR